jgi:hypothetical protein
MPPVYPAGSYPAAVVADGAVAYWRLDETSGLTAVDVVGALNGTISGNVTLNQAGALTDPSPAMQFGGGTGQIAIPASAILDLQYMSFEAWVYITSNPGSQAIYEKTNDGAINSGVSVQLLTGTGWRARVLRAGDFFPVMVDAGAAPLNAWTHLAVTCDTTLRMYLNGVPVGTPAAVAGGLRRGVATAVLASLTGTWRFIGRLDEVAVYPTALSPAQIAAHYAAKDWTAAPPRFALQYRWCRYVQRPYRYGRRR